MKYAIAEVEPLRYRSGFEIFFFGPYDTREAAEHELEEAIKELTSLQLSGPLPVQVVEVSEVNTAQVTIPVRYRKLYQ